MASTAILKLQTGPAREFISQARQTRDLWAGGWLLNHLTRAAARALQEQPGAELILPHGLAEPGESLEATMPHAILARVPASRAGEIAQLAERAVRGEWERIASAVHALVSKTAQPGWDADWPAAIREFPQVQWIIHPCAGDPETLRWLAHRQPPLPDQSPDFQQPGSSLEALHVATAEWKFAALLNSRGFARSTDFPLRRELLGASSGRFAPQEGCSILTLIKRLFPEAYLRDQRGWQELAPQFESLQHIAAAIDAAGNDVFPGPQAFYAILALDGDEISRWLGGCKSPTAGLDPRRSGYVEALSERLSTFAIRASGIVDQYVGQLISGGSDHVLALLPAAGALPCADEMARAFAQVIPGASASAGIAFGHVRAPLEQTIQAAFAARDRAKASPGKDAFCLRIIPQTGSCFELTADWRSGVVRVWRDLEERKRSLCIRFPQEVAERLRKLLLRRSHGTVQEWEDQWTNPLKDAALLELVSSLQRRANLPRKEAEALAQSWLPLLSRLPPRDAVSFWLAWAFLRRADDAFELAPGPHA